MLRTRDPLVLRIWRGPWLTSPSLGNTGNSTVAPQPAALLALFRNAPGWPSGVPSRNVWEAPSLPHGQTHTHTLARIIPTQRMGPLFSSPGGIAVPKAIPRVPDLTLLLAAPLHVPTPGAMGPAGDEVQRGHLGETGAPPAQAPGMKSPRWESRATLTFPGEPEALARPWWPEGLSPAVWEAQDLQPPPRPA